MLGMTLTRVINSQNFIDVHSVAYEEDDPLQSNNNVRQHLARVLVSLRNTFTFGNSWAFLPDKMKRINENPVYRNFNITNKIWKPHITIILIVSSAPKRFDRRKAIRETWWKQCKSNSKVG